MRWRDRLNGVVLGAIIGIGIVTAFVFLYSEQTVDAPPPIAHVSVIGGAPPTTGPAELHYRKGDVVRLRVTSDASIGRLVLLGYGISFNVAADEPELIRFKASKAGNFPLIVAVSHIDVARITVGQ